MRESVGSGFLWVLEGQAIFVVLGAFLKTGFLVFIFLSTGQGANWREPVSGSGLPWHGRRAASLPPAASHHGAGCTWSLRGEAAAFRG